MGQHFTRDMAFEHNGVYQDRAEEAFSLRGHADRRQEGFRSAFLGDMPTGASL